MEFDKIFDESNEIKIKEQQLGKKLQVNLMKKVKTKFGDSYLLYNKKYNKRFFANSQLKAYLNKLVSNLNVDGEFYYKDNELTPIVEFIIKGVGEKVQLAFLKKKEDYVHEVLKLSDDEQEDNLLIRLSKK